MFGEGTDAQGGNNRDPNNPGPSDRWSVVDALRDEIRLIDTLGGARCVAAPPPLPSADAP